MCQKLIRFAVLPPPEPQSRLRILELLPDTERKKKKKSSQQVLLVIINIDKKELGAEKGEVTENSLFNKVSGFFVNLRRCFQTRYY